MMIPSRALTTTTRLVGVLLTLAFGAACSQAGSTPTGPSANASFSSTGSGGSATLAAKPAAGTAATTLGFSAFDASTLTVSVNTLTTASVGQPYIDQGKIQLEILVDASGNPVPCGAVGATYVRFDTFTNGGKPPSAGITTTVVDLDNLETTTGGVVHNVHCGDRICIRAHYITGGGATHVDTHISTATPYDIVCASVCTLGQGFWKTHHPGAWPGSVISSGLTLGTVNYTAAQLESIFNTAPVGNGLLILAHQLIAAKLNIANGADGSAVASAIAAADALIGGLVVPPVGSDSLAPGTTSALTQTLDDYNSGVTGPGHCPESED